MHIARLQKRYLTEHQSNSRSILGSCQCPTGFHGEKAFNVTSRPPVENARDIKVCNLNLHSSILKPHTMSLTKEEIEAHFERAAETYEDNFPLMKVYAAAAINSVPPITPSSVVHDNASGPGIVAGVILSSPSFASGSELPKIHATDLSNAMIKILKKKPWADKVDAQVMNSLELTFPDATFTHSFTNFTLMMMPLDDAKKAAAEIYRTLQPGGTAEVSTWQKLGPMDLFKEVVQQIKPDAVVHDVGPIRAHWMAQEMLRDVLVAGGFKTEQIEIKAVARDIPGSMWGKEGMQSFNQILTKQVTEGWEDGEREAFLKALEERIAQEQKEPRNYQMIAWIAVAKK